MASAQPDAWEAPRQIRFVNNQGRPPSKRRRISAACLTCRRRKTRCAGEKPLCSTCTKNGHECLGYPDETGNGKTRTDDDLDALPEEDDDSEDDPEVQQKPAKASKSAETTRSKRKAASPLPKPANKRIPASPVISPPNIPPHTPTTVSLDDLPASPTLQRAKTTAHRVPYFRYFGPTAIVPGFKQMVVSVRDRQTNTTSHSEFSPVSGPSGLASSSPATGVSQPAEDLPSYDPSCVGPVPPLVIHLVETFFLHIGCNYPFLKQAKFLRQVREKRAEGILVDAVCALAARFSDAPLLTGGNSKMPRTERGQTFAQRAKAATVDTFPCPSVGAVQACLLMAYESFGANQDSALWMYLGLAIRMAVDLGIQKRVGVQYQGEKDPTARKHANADPDSPQEMRDGLSWEEQKEIEQERSDTFWAVFVLDRVISSGTGRPVSIRDDDFDLPLPEQTTNSATGWPTLFPVLVQIIHMYGRVSDVLNNIHEADDLTQERWSKLVSMEKQLTKLYKAWDARLQFNVDNFKAYLGLGQGNLFILLHLWFHALFIMLHQPTLLSPTGSQNSELQLLSDSRELSMSSAKTICDILAFADLIDQKSFIGNPFTSQPIYIAAGAFIMESHMTPARQQSPPPAKASKKSTKHSLLASAASQNYQRCYTSLQQIHEYWGGIKYILTALDQKAKGLRDLETFTDEEYESTKEDQDSLTGQLARFENHGSPAAAGPPIAWSLSGTAYSPNSSLTVMYQSGNGTVTRGAAPTSRPNVSSPGFAYDAVRHQQTSNMFPPAIPQPNTSSVRHSPRRGSRVGEEDSMFHTGFTPVNAGYDPSYGSVVDANYYGQNMGYHGWSPVAASMDGITFNSQDIDIGALGLQQPDIMSGWLDYIPNDVLGLFENQDMNQGGNQ